MLIPYRSQKALVVRNKHRAGAIALALSAFLLLSGCGVGAGDDASEPTFTPKPPEPTVTATLPAIPDDTPTAESDSTQAGGIVVSVNTAVRYPISPLIYGVADPTTGDEDTLKWLGAGLMRWGGNARTRHNWEINASNAGADWEFRNVSQGDTVPGSASLGFMQRDERLGAASILTMPTIGWVAKDSDNNTRSTDVPKHGGPAVSKGSDTAFTEVANDVWTTPYDPSANRARTSVQSLPSKGAPFTYPPDLTDGKVYQDEWVAYLRDALKDRKQPVIYAMDNEPELWSDEAHVDVHPVRPGYDDALQTFLTYAKAVKKVDPQGLIAGPESWGVTGYLFSALDNGTDKFGTAADRKAHGGIPWLQWFLRSVAADDAKAGSRSLDVLTVHYYPTAGQYEGGNDAPMQDKRMQAPRALWDGLYIEPSWVANTEWASPGLARRLTRMIEQSYPGTKLGITEWNFGGADDISGAIATADALGIFGRERMYMASYWGLPKQSSATGWAFRMYRNYDGKGSSFGSQSVETSIDNTKTMSAYGALSEDGSKLTVMLINKQRGNSTDVSIKADGFTPGKGTLYRYTAQSAAGGPQADPVTVTDPAAVQVSLAPMSITLVELTK